jgi:hypothetical protein
MALLRPDTPWLRVGIEKETEGVILVPTYHSPPAIPIAPLQCI